MYILLLTFNFRRSLTTLLVQLTCVAFYAQEDGALVSSYINRLQGIFDSAQYLVPEHQITLDTDSSLISFVTGIQPNKNGSISNGTSNDEQLFIAKQNLLKRQLGLNYSFDAVQNFNANQKDLEDNILYQRRYLNSLEWNLLKDGFLDAKDDINALSLEQELKKRTPISVANDHSQATKMSHLIFWFNKRKIETIQKRTKLLQSQKDIVERLYYSKKITREYMLNHQMRLAEIEAMLDIYATYNDYIQPQFDTTAYNWEAPLFDLNYEALASKVLSVASVNADSSTAQLISQIEQQNKWYNEIRMKAYLRHSYYDLITTDPSSRAFFSAGVGLTVPLKFTHREQNVVDRERALSQLKQIKAVSDNNTVELLNEAYEYRFQLKQYIIFNQKRVLLLESIRKERVKQRLHDADFNPLHALELVDDLYRIETELLDLKQSLYLRLMKIHDKMKVKPIGELIVPIELPNYFDVKGNIATGEKGQTIIEKRSVVVSNKAIEDHSVDFISEYILYNGFNEVLLEVSENDTLKDLKIRFLQLMSRQNIQVSLMFDQNQLLKGDAFGMRTTILDHLDLYPLKLVKGIHFQLGSKLISEKNHDALKSLVKQMKLISEENSLLLSFDISIKTDSNLVKEMLPDLDVIRFVTNGTVARNTLTEGLKVYRNHLDQLSFSARTSDFASRADMEAFATTFCQESGIKMVDFYSLSQLIDLDKKALMNGVEMEKTSAKKKIADVNQVVGDTHVTELKPSVEVTKEITPVDSISVAEGRNGIERSVYIWTKSFNLYTVEYILGYVLRNKFQEVELAVSQEDPYFVQKVELMEYLQRNNVKVALMYGSNQILDLDFKKMKTELKETFGQYPLNLAQSLHLDVEPQGRDDWKQNKEWLKGAYKILVDEASKLSDSLNKQLTIDLPVWHDVAYVEQLMNKVDLVRFMCYENINPDHIKKMLTPYLNQKKKVSMSLRTEDFKTRAEMEAFAKKYKAELGIETVNFHDLNRLIKLSDK